MQRDRKIALIGAMVFLISWITQNYIYKSYSEKKEKMEYDISFINTAMVGVTPLFVHYVTEIKRDSLNKELIWHLAVNHVSSMVPIIQVSEQYVDFSKSSNLLTRDKLNTIIDEMKEAFKDGEIDTIIKLTDMVASTIPIMGDYFRKELQKSYVAIHRKIEIWKHIFLVLYILGSLLSIFGLVRRTKNS